MFKRNTTSKNKDALQDQPVEAFNLSPEIKDDLARIDKLFELVNVLCDVLMDKPPKKINNWATLKPDDLATKINNAFLL